MDKTDIKQHTHYDAFGVTFLPSLTVPAPAQAGAGADGAPRLAGIIDLRPATSPGEVVYYGTFQTPVGDMVLFANDEGLCWAGFVRHEDGGAEAIGRMRRDWPDARLVKDESRLAPYARLIQHVWSGNNPDMQGMQQDPVPVCVRGTDFQIRVWQVLSEIPMGAVVSYGAIARWLGHPRASRAVGGAVGANPVSVLVPCHRVIQSNGRVENYGWGSELKKQILSHEAAIAGASGYARQETGAA